MQIQVGCDPEVFVQDSSGVRSVIGLIGGTKNRPLPLPLGEGFAVQEDNVALEFNIPAAGSKAEFIKSVLSATNYLEQLVKDKYGFTFLNSSAESFPEKELCHPTAWVFGCDPDFNAWTKTVNPKPSAEDKALRSCGGHIHIGLEGQDIDIIEVIRAMDFFAAIPATLMDKGELRQRLYGKRGAFRKKKYGVEYRTLSNFWIFSEELVSWAYDQTQRAVDFVAAGNSVTEYDKEIEQIVDGHNKVLAREFVDTFNLTTVGV